MAEATPGPPPDFAARIRARGSVLDMQLVRDLYAPLLAAQSTAGVAIQRDLPYGSDPRQRLDLYLSLIHI